MKHRPDLSPRMENLNSFSSCVSCTKVGHNFGCHMNPAEFYASSDALVHLQISTEYLSKSCRTVSWMPCLASKLAVAVKVQQTDSAGAKG